MILLRHNAHRIVILILGRGHILVLLGFVERRPEIIELQAAKPAMIKLPAAQLVQKVNDSRLHTVYAISPSQSGEIH